MTIKRPTLLTVLTLALAIIAGWLAGRTTAAQAQSSAVAPQQQRVSSDQKAGTWEYRILTGGPGPNLEGEINKLAAQGFVVESFQVTSPANGSGGATFFAFSSVSQVVVLLKRIKN
jgi:hypothetical protein